MKKFNCNFFKKTRNLIRRKQDRFRDFENLILEDEFMNIIHSIDDQEENLYDVLLFCTQEEYKTYEEFLLEKIQEIEELKNGIVNNYECKISEYKDYSKEEALIELNDFIEDSKFITTEYYNEFKNSVDRLLPKLRVIKHVPLVVKKFKHAKFNYLNIQRNLINLNNIISVDNCKEILIKNFEKLEETLETKFQNFTRLIEKLEGIKMEPCALDDTNSQRSPISDESNSSIESYYEAESEKKEVEEKNPSDCFFVEESSGNTRMDSMEKLKTEFSLLQHQIESIEESKNQLNQKIEGKKKEICDALDKVAEFEAIIEEIEGMIEDKLYNFQQRLISLESKLVDNYKNGDDQELKSLLESEINELKHTFHIQSTTDDKNLYELIQQGQIFASSIGNIFTDVEKFCETPKIVENLEKLQKLLNRQAQYCFDSKGRRFYLNKEKEKIFQDEHHTSHYKLSKDGEITVIKEGFAIETDNNGEFYKDKKNERKIYIKYYFEDNFGRYYIDINGNRHYKADSEASEYMLVNGVWIQIKEGIYARDERGMRIRPEEDVTDDDFENNDDFTSENKDEQGPGISSEDLKYIKETVGPAIIKACTATFLNKPSDPVKYFANFLLHFRYTEKMLEAREKELNYFVDLRKQLEMNCDEHRE